MRGSPALFFAVWAFVIVLFAVLLPMEGGVFYVVSGLFTVFYLVIGFLFRREFS